MTTESIERRILGLLGLGVLFAIVAGCGAGGLFGPNVLPSSVDDPSLNPEDYEIIASQAEVPGTWNLEVRSRRQTNNTSTLTFRWDFGDGQTSEGTAQTHTFEEPGDYRIVVRGINSNGNVVFTLTLDMEIPVGNRTPTITLADAQTVFEGETVFLDASSATDPDGDELGFIWQQISGPDVLLNDANLAIANFVAPQVEADTELIFALQITDGAHEVQILTTINVLLYIDPSSVGIPSCNFTVSVNEGTSSEDFSPPFGGQRPLTVKITGNTIGTNPPVGSTYIWTVNGVDESRPAEVNATMIRVLNTPGVHVFSLALAVAASTVRCQSSQTGEFEETVTGWPEILGVVEDVDGGSVSGVTVSASLGGTTAVTDANGSFKVRVPFRWSGQVTAQHVNYEFSPASQTFSNVQFDVFDQRFVAQDPGTPIPGGCTANAQCDNGQFCDGIETCVAQVCATGSSPCPTDQTCDEANDRCVATPAECVAASPTWYNEPFAPRAGSFEVQFDARPSVSPMDGVFGLSSAASTTYSGFAALVRFSSFGNIDVRNGATYQAQTTFPYVGGTTYRFRMVVNVTTRTYSVFVRPQGLTQETALATNFSFRSEQGSVTTLGNWGTIASTASHSVCSLTVGAAVLLASAGQDVTIPPGGNTSLTGSASGGEAPYTFRWSPTTGLSNANIANPIASPSTTTTYTLTVTDSLAATANDSLVITVALTPLAASAGPDRVIATGGSTTLAGSATGGTPPYTYRWSPTTGLSNANIAGPTASPAATTTYTLTATDSQARTAVDAVVVTITSGAICDYIINAGESINKYSSTAQPGQTVCVRAGNYSGTLSPAVSGTPGNLVTFRAYPGDECKGDSSAMGRQYKSDCRVVLSGAVSTDAAYTRIEGFEVKNTPSNGISVYANGVEIVNNFVHDASGGAGNGSANCMYLDRDVSNVLVENNEVTGCGRGIKMEDGTPTFITLRGNNVHLVQDGLRGAASNSVYENNWIHQMTTLGGHRDALDLAGSFNNLTIRNNMISDFSQLIYVPGDGESRTWENFYIYGNVLLVIAYPGDSSGDAPGIKMAAYSGQTLRNLYIHSNTCGKLGMTKGGNCINDLSGAENVVIRNNIAYESSFSIGSGQINSDYNLFYSSTGDPRANDYAGEGPNSIYVNPQFENYQPHSQTALDFRLKSTSPAIDRGSLAPIAVPSGFRDFLGVLRPQDGPDADLTSQWDMGAFERTP